MDSLTVSDGMTLERFDNIMWHQTEELTEAEVALGWHFCCEMDGLLLNANDPDNEFCHCFEDCAADSLGVSA